jgi:hypothetical protein
MSFNFKKLFTYIVRIIVKLLKKIYFTIIINYIKFILILIKLY